MKRSMQLVCALIIMIIGNMAYAWTYTFNNSFQDRIGVRVKLSGINEPWYYAKIEKGGKYVFEFGVNKQAQLDLEGTQQEYTGRKVGLCLDEIEVILLDNNWKPISNSPYGLFNWSVCPMAATDQATFNTILTASKTNKSRIIYDLMRKLGLPYGYTTNDLLIPGRLNYMLSLSKTISYCANREFTIFPNIKEDGTIIQNQYCALTVI